MITSASSAQKVVDRVTVVGLASTVLDFSDGMAEGVGRYPSGRTGMLSRSVAGHVEMID